MRDIESSRPSNFFDGNKEKRDEQRRMFEDGSIQNPHLDYPNLEKQGLDEREKRLLSLKEQIINEEENETVRRLYRWRINEKIAEVRLLKASHFGDMRTFRRYSSFIYRTIDKDIFSACLDEVQGEEQTAIPYPSQQLRGVVRKYTKEEFKEILPHLGEGELNHQEIVDAFTIALTHLKLSGWKIISSSSSKKLFQ